MGCFTASLAFSNMVCHPPQVFQQHHPQRSGQRPELAQTELVDFLVCLDKSLEQRGLQHTVGMGHIGPGNTVNTWQTFQRLARQLGQISVVMARQTFLDLLKLRFNQMKIVKQPLCRWSDVLAALRNCGDVVVRLAQSHQIFPDAREK